MRMFVKPKTNPETGEPMHIRFPRTRAILPADGAVVDLAADQSFWQRRVRDGDVIIATPAPKLAEAAAE